MVAELEDLKNYKIQAEINIQKVRDEYKSKIVSLSEEIRKQEQE